ncbi:hypothetical protein DYB37_014001 [Aphanomyces astaci]|uniref:GAG-pre-integrase domain-containing protein n=1 Tax=Aphanomyces astaci TaxID=112090 RepID=A0A3R7A228_APHAT|nr:hypothetical protein DYB35_014035 [Aphanomyces astaci]RHZ27809.1 hypothetical protein DYB37_014001 [Aphanomyces astaci]
MPSGDGAPSNPTNGTPYLAAVDIDNANQPLLHPSSTNRPDSNRETNNEDEDVTSETFQDGTSMKLENRDEYGLASPLVHYAETTDLDQCNNVHVPTHQEGIMDNGATAHMTGDLALLHCIVPCKRGVRLADDHAITTLQSISRITQHSDEAVLNFKHDYCAVNVKDHLSIVAKWNDAYLYSMRSELILPGDDDEVNTAEKLGAGLWHARMGHIPAVTMTAVGKATTGEPKQVLKQSHARTA